MSNPPSPRRRHSRRRYAVRRAVALGLLLAVGFVVVRAVASMAGGDEGVVDADGSTVVDIAPAASAAADVTTEGSAPVDTASVDTMAVEPESTGPPSVDNPSKVFIVGDSDAGTFGPYLQTLLDGTGIVTTELDYKVSSGLARPDFYDWPAEIDAKLPTVDPDIVVATFGGNDAQGSVGRERRVHRGRSGRERGGVDR